MQPLISINTCLFPAQVIIYFYISAGLRKLEAFFGFLITVMAFSFGYEVRFGHS